jgi:hypothetical protein
MAEKPPLSLNLFPDRQDENKDWYGFLNIKKENVAVWIAFLSDQSNLCTSNTGEVEITIPLIGWDQTTRTGDRAISVVTRQSRPQTGKTQGSSRRWN